MFTGGLGPIEPSKMPCPGIFGSLGSSKKDIFHLFLISSSLIPSRKLVFLVNSAFKASLESFLSFMRRSISSS
jgi:hypothetical protein